MSDLVKKTDEIRIRAAAKGRIQRKMADNLIRSGSFDNPCPDLKGKASDYAGSYKRSFHNFADPVKSHGVDLEYVAGPYGGDHSSSYKLASAEEYDRSKVAV